MAKKKNREAIIHNGRFAYELIVDGQSIEFQGMAAAEYFEKHYTNIGYVVRRSGDGSLNYKEQGCHGCMDVDRSNTYT